MEGPGAGSFGGVVQFRPNDSNPLDAKYAFAENEALGNFQSYSGKATQAAISAGRGRVGLGWQSGFVQNPWRIR